MKLKHAWVDELKIGDVIYNGRRYRAVRDVSHKKNGQVHCVTLSILHCSWTQRPYTTYNRYDLTYMGYQRVPGVRAKFDTPRDKKLNEYITSRHVEKRSMTCCDVDGML